jgi:hypothetical protein
VVVSVSGVTLEAKTCEATLSSGPTRIDDGDVRDGDGDGDGDDDEGRGKERGKAEEERRKEGRGWARRTTPGDASVSLWFGLGLSFVSGLD